MKNLPVVAAIPNYNMANELRELLPLLISQGYKAIFVLDDASTDDSRQVVENFGKGVRLIKGAANLGSGGNRNRVLQALDYDALIHFLDADTRPETTDMPAVIRRHVPAGEFAFLGGLVKDLKGIQSVWNYGPRPSLRNEIGALRQYQLGQLIETDSEKAKKFRDKHAGLLEPWPDPFAKPVPQETFWCVESNFVFRSDIFRRYGGFNESIREIDIIELAIRMHKDGLKAMFDPSFSVIHTEAQVRNYNRGLRKRNESIRLALRHGIIKWLFTDWR